MAPPLTGRSLIPHPLFAGGHLHVRGIPGWGPWNPARLEWDSEAFVDILLSTRQADRKVRTREELEPSWKNRRGRQPERSGCTRASRMRPAGCGSRWWLISNDPEQLTESTSGGPAPGPAAALSCAGRLRRLQGHTTICWSSGWGFYLLDRMAL